MRLVQLLLLCSLSLRAETLKTGGLKQPVEVLVDKWGISHIYAKNQDDLFFAQGWVVARDRLFQIDSWRRSGTGHWAEVQGASAIPRDRLARLIRYRGDWEAEWKSYSPDTKQIATAFTFGINAYISQLKVLPPEFVKAGYTPALWVPEDVTARMAGLLMMHNVQQELDRAIRMQTLGPDVDSKLFPTNPPTEIKLADGLALGDFKPEILADLRAALRGGPGDGQYEETTPEELWEGSNNWVVSGTRTATGKPILSNDPHRSITLPSLRKTFHLVAPGWDVIGAGEPALPGIALGHNQNIGFGFTIVNIDQMDLFVETLNPANPSQYRYKDEWRNIEIEHQFIDVKGQDKADVILGYTIHGPILYTDAKTNKAFALKWVGAEPGAAGYLAGLRLARANNWNEFKAAAKYFKVPSENLVYADRQGNIGWIAAGEAPIRPNHNGVLPVPGESGKYDWAGYLSIDQHPQQYNPARGWIATANHNILPPDYKHVLGYNFALPYRFERIAEVLAGQPKHTVEDSRLLQQDVTSVAARRFQNAVTHAAPKLTGHAQSMAEMLKPWKGVLNTESTTTTVYVFWQDTAFAAAFDVRPRPSLEVLLHFLETDADALAVLQKSGDQAWSTLTRKYGPDRAKWEWGDIHTLTLKPLAPVGRPGDANTPNATGGPFPAQNAGASFREILDLADWDRSISTNVPGESADPASPHFSDLLLPWSKGEYHPLTYTRKAVEVVTTERLTLQ